MARLFTMLLLLLPIAATVAQEEPPRSLTFEEASMGRAVRFSGSLPRIDWASDGIHLIRREKGKELWIHPLTKEEKEPAPAPQEVFSPDEVAVAFEAREDFETGDAKRAAESRIAASKDGQTVLLAYENDLYLYRKAEPVRRLTESEAREQTVALTENGRYAAFVEGNDLFVIETFGGGEEQSAPIRVTNDGSESIYNGIFDWVYQEEIYGRGTWKAHWWSPDGSALAYLRLDDANVPRYTILDHRSRHPAIEVSHYPKSGDPNPKASLRVFSPRSRRSTVVDLSRYGDDFLVVRVDWLPDGRRVAVQIQDRAQRWLDLTLADPRSGELEVLFRESSKTWVNVLESPRWFEDGSFLWHSERTGFRHLYHYEASGKLRATVTAGEWSVSDVVRIDEKGGSIYFTATKDGAVDVNVYRGALSGQGEPLRLTAGVGSHSIELNADGSLFLDRCSSVESPPELRLCRTSDGAVLDVLGTTEIEALKKYHYTRPELARIPARDGHLLDVSVIKPHPFDPSVPHPVWISTYAGPAAPSVRNRWNDSAWEQFLSQQGFVVLQVNNRSSSRESQKSTAACYRNLGASELGDIEDAIDWLCSNPWADEHRVGITGTSYGGFMTAYALTHSKKFRLGVAGAGVYDWHLYDTIYTERYMDTPAENPEGYLTSSCIAAAANLHGYLVMWHGTMDDNVHLQNAVQLAEALQEADKRFELMIYPGSRHGVRSSGQRQHLRRTTYEAMLEHLEPKRPSAVSAGE